MKNFNLKRGDSHSIDGSIFNIVVMGTVSSGKTTLLNALLGQELLFSSNEPATASHIRLCHRPRSRLMASSAYDHNGNLLDLQSGIDAATIKQWNACPGVHRIHVRGDLGHIAGLRRNIDLHDIPGANNSLDTSHSGIAKDTLTKIPWTLLCYVLDATTPATHDEVDLLKQLRMTRALRPHASVLFVLNKVDALDPDNNESIEAQVARTHQRLQQLGFNDPWIVPTMARIALVARLKMAQLHLSARQAMSYQAMLPELPAAARSIFSASHVPREVAERLQPELQALKTQEFNALPSNPPTNFTLLSASATASGVRLVEGIIQHCISYS